ncbi:hypothetical protein K1T71_013775 [Dendrolimus kikuchii]|uniref:Uncharacterized protein n=1 Tax=Dendrolimus kikuchii TaxID=765133 RepID=A0ACC1CFR6_9NEOP|nr:hypothetical protein K1T71_013775 [Dendrolimus kikuchii]
MASTETAIISFILLKCCLGQESSTDSSNKTIKFVNIIKEDLRKNNEDYADALALKLSSTFTEDQTSIKDVAKYNTRNNSDSLPKYDYKRDKDDKIFVDNLRRAYELKTQDVNDVDNTTNNMQQQSVTKHVHKRILPNKKIPKNINSVIFNKIYGAVPSEADITVNPKAPKPINNVKLQKVKKFNLQKAGQQTNTQKQQMLKQNQLPKNINKVQQMNNFKKFLEKNKDMIRDFVQKDKTDPELSRKRTAFDLESFDDMNEINLPEKVQRPTFKAKVDPDMQRLRANLNMGENDIPNSEQLDMAHAKGGRVHSMRIKGRLCHRHVLIPEGPKYDSKGVVYLPAFEPKGRRDYDQTKAPEVLLPRCCNCCKKSVLGCE